MKHDYYLLYSIGYFAILFANILESEHYHKKRGQFGLRRVFSLSNSFTICSTIAPSLQPESIVAMAVYEGDRLDWVSQSVKSILQQEYKDFVFILIVDGEINASTLTQLEQTASENEHVLLVRGTNNHGLSQCMNYAIDYSLLHIPSAKYFFRMDADDISEPARLLKQVQFFNENPSVSVLGTSLVEINEMGKVVGQRQLPLEHEQIVRVFPRRCALNHPTVGVRVSVFAEGHRYRPDLLNTQDYFLWVELCADNFVFANLPEALLRFRRVNDFYKRRGFNKSLNEFKARFFAMRKLKRITMFNIIYAVAVILLRMMPAKMIKLAYKIDRFFLNR